MNPLILIAGLFVLYEVLTHSGAVGSIGSVAPSSPYVPPSNASQTMLGSMPIYSPNEPTAQSAVGSGANSIVASGQGFVQGGPVGAIVAGVTSLIGGLSAAHKLRMQEAQTENGAVVLGVQGWDQGVKQTVAAYNAGSITYNDALSMLATPRTGGFGKLWQFYWEEVGPKVQPQRNGCKSGTVQQDPSKSFCGGNSASAGMAYGAGCCVGYDNLDVGSSYIVAALQQAEANPGRSITSKTVPTVYSSKYGGVNRQGYSVTFRKPVTSSLFGL